MNQADFEAYFLSFAGSHQDDTVADEVIAYKAGPKPGRLFGLIRRGSQPLQISLRCDPQLAKQLKAQYESVIGAAHLNKKYWVTIIDSGQLTDEDIKDFIRLSYLLATDSPLVTHPLH